MKTNKFIYLGSAMLIGLFIYGCSIFQTVSSGTVICSDYSTQPMSTLEVGLVHEMVNGYKGNQLQEINNRIPNDAQSIWFDLETLKQFIYQVEMNAKQNNVSSQDLGIRFYYASYPEENLWGKFPDLIDVPANYKKLHTLVGIATINRKGIDYDFDPTNPDTYNKNLKEIEAYNNPNTPVTAMGVSNASRSSGSSTIGARNHGSVIPPATNGGATFQ